MHPTHSLRNVSSAGLLALLASACATGIGPRALRTERPDYNQQIVRSADGEMLLNLVRLRYNDSPLFLELGAVVAQYGFDASLSATGQVGSGAGQATVGTGLGYSESPTITYTPLKGEDFAERLLTPVSLNSLMLFVQTGWSAERLLLMIVQRVNDLFNAPTATGPTPEHPPDYEAFADFATRFHRLYEAQLIGLNWEMKQGETDAPGQNSTFWIRAPADPRSPLAADVAAVRRYLDLERGREEFELTAFPFRRHPNQLGIRCRSLLAVLYFLAESVQTPPEHIEAGLVAVTRDENGQPFDWSKVMGDIMTIHSQRDFPDKAFVAVRHRGFWFYVADADQSSKATFGLLNLLFSLQSATGSGKSPLLTLPVSR